jgi:homoserine acetyltransferase
MLGNGESSSPSNCPTFPKAIHYQDCINSQAILLTQHLKITTLDAVLGFSMGGQQAYYWAVMHSLPSALSSTIHLKSAICICTSARTSGHNYAFLEGPIAALETSFDYAHGQYRRNGVHPTQGLRAFGRAYAAWLTSPEWFRQELWRKMGAASLREWLYPPLGEMGFESWDAEDLLLLARMWQAGDVGTVVGGSGGYRAALAGVQCRVLVMPSRTDQYFAAEDSEIEVRNLKRGRLEVIETIWGHIAGGGANAGDVKWMDGRIGEFLGGEDGVGGKL